MTRRSLRRPLPRALTAGALAIALVASSGSTPASAAPITDIPLLDDYDAESLANLPAVGGLQYLAQRYAPTDTCPPVATGPGGPLFWGDDKPVQFRQGVPRPGQRIVKIVINGDSYMSGEGAGNYYNKRGFLPEPMRFLPGPNGGRIPAEGHSEADYDEDFRHRSANAAVLQAIDLLRRANPEVFFDVRFNASSGAATEHFFVGQNDEGRVNLPQNEGLDAATDLVISGFGGNDARFGPMLRAVLDKSTSTLNSIEAEIAPLLDVTRTSEQEWADSEPPRPPFVRPLTQPSTISARLVQLVRAMNGATSGKARIMMVNYPQPFADGLQPGGLMGWVVRPADWAHLRALGPRLTAAIKKAQQVLADHGMATDMLDIANAFAGHELGTRTPYVRGVAWSPAVQGNSFNRTQQSGHPNQEGQKALAGHYALMIAGELGLRLKASDGAPPPARAAEPCDPDHSDRHYLPAKATQSGGGSTGGTGGGGGGGTSTPNVGPRSTMTYVNIDPPLSQPTNPGPRPTPADPQPSPGTPEPATPRWTIYPVDTVQPTNPTISFDLTQPLPYLWPVGGGSSPYRDVFEVKINTAQLMR
ncbi:hypothetical protein ACFFV7_46505 [Nonomuraea spiralis]|uniref:Uncharacterized protein n=1 Tax=Nonomuraea spiralis TaxID=46182 RepID=A0ABV5IVW1_9ACTN|nr:hypothetical protein [Nonomuraea spiralis]